MATELSITIRNAGEIAGFLVDILGDDTDEQLNTILEQLFHYESWSEDEDNAPRFPVVLGYVKSALFHALHEREIKRWSQAGLNG
jgi:hypothetical protein